MGKGRIEHPAPKMSEASSAIYHCKYPWEHNNGVTEKVHSSETHVPSFPTILKIWMIVRPIQRKWLTLVDSIASRTRGPRITAWWRTSSVSNWTTQEWVQRTWSQATTSSSSRPPTRASEVYQKGIGNHSKVKLRSKCSLPSSSPSSTLNATKVLDRDCHLWSLKWPQIKRTWALWTCTATWR